MTTRTFTLILTVAAEPGHMAFDTTALADIVQGALETGSLKCVVKGIEDVKVPPVHSATVDAFLGDHLKQASEGQRAATELHRDLRTG